MSDLVFIDNTVLSNFARVGQSDLLLQVWPNTARTSPDEILNR